MFMGRLPKISIFMVSSKPTCKVKRCRRVRHFSQIVEIILCGHVLGIMRSIMRFQTERGGSGKYLLGLLEGAELLLKYFSLSSRKRTENVKRPSRHISVSLVEKGGVLEM